MYAIDLKENKLQGFVNITGKRVQSEDLGNNDQPKDTRLPAWAKILISIVSIVVIVILILGIWLYFRYKNYVNPSDKNKQKMQEIWALSGAEATINNNGDVTCNLGDKNFTNGITPLIHNDEAMIGYGIFHHDVDFKDMEETKIPTDH
jgi:hypothetical protein